jgi:hypothetical protein
MLSVQTSHLSSVEATASRGARHGPAVGLQLGVDEPVGRRGDTTAQPDSVSTGLMLLIIVPGIALTRCCLHGATARPTRRLTTARTGTTPRQLELVIWAALLIIIRAGRDHLDQHPLMVPPISVDAARRAKTAELRGVVAVGSGCSSGELYRSTGGPVQDHVVIVMNSFLSTLAGQIRDAGGDQTARSDQQAGSFDGFANYSGHGFPGIALQVPWLQPGEFDKWVQTNKAEAAAADALTTSNWKNQRA